MSYKLTDFDGVPLPDAMPTDDLSTGMVESSLRDSIGGVYNYFGSAQRLPRRHQIPHKGKYVGEVDVRVTSDGDTRVTSDGDTRVTAASKLADLAGKTDDLKSMIGKWAPLWRERLTDGQLTWKQCRLLQVRHVETVEQANVVSEVETVFETSDVGWRSEGAVTTSVNAVGGTPVALNVPNAGALQVNDAIVRIARTSGTITQVSITGAGIDITWTGSIGASETLEIDAGEQTVLIGSTEQYSGFSLGSGHSDDHWLPLAPGSNILIATVTGGNATVSVEHYNQWP